MIFDSFVYLPRVAEKDTQRSVKSAGITEESATESYRSVFNI